MDYPDDLVEFIAHHADVSFAWLLRDEYQNCMVK